MPKKFFLNIKEQHHLTKRRYIYVLFSIYATFAIIFFASYFILHKKAIDNKKNLMVSYQYPFMQSAYKYAITILKKFTDFKTNVKNIVYLDLKNKILIVGNKTIPFSYIRDKDIEYIQNLLTLNKNMKFFYGVLPYFSYNHTNYTIGFFKKINEKNYKIYVFNPEKPLSLLDLLPSTLTLKIKIGDKVLFDTNRKPVYEYKEYKYFIGNLPVDIYIGLVKTFNLAKYEKFEDISFNVKIAVISIFLLILTILNIILLYKESEFVNETIKNVKTKLSKISQLLQIHFEAPYLETFIPKFLKNVKTIFNADKVYLRILPNQNFYVDEDGIVKSLNLKSIEKLEKKFQKDESGNEYKEKGKYYFYFPIKIKKGTLGYIILETSEDLSEIDKNLLKIVVYTLGGILDSELKLEDIFYLMANVIEARDPYTKGHSLRVAYYAKWIAEKLGLPEETCEKIFKAGVLHDIGKIGIPDIVLLKPGRLTDQEYEIMKLHAEFTYYILKTSSSLREFAEIARYHHERWDGRGYPKGLKGEEIPLESRILSVADAIDAMTSTRPYRKALSFEKAKEELLYNAGKQFDPKIISTILPYIDELKAIKSQVDMQIEKFLPEEIEKFRSYVFFYDPTTGCHRVTSFIKELDNLIVKEEEFCLALIDVHDFLDIIEATNFDVADQILAKIAQIIKEYSPLVSRDSDIFCFVIKDKNCEKILKEIEDRIRKELKIDIFTYLVRYNGEKRTGHELLIEALKKLKELKKEKK